MGEHLISEEDLGGPESDHPHLCHPFRHSFLSLPLLSPEMNERERKIEPQILESTFPIQSTKIKHFTKLFLHESEPFEHTEWPW